MLNERMEKEINKQINAELYSSYLYLSMAAYFERFNLKGFSNWLRVQAQEEIVHAIKFFNYICEVGARINLTSISTPPNEWKSPLHVFEEAFSHEVMVTSLINNLVNIAVEEKDHRTNNFLQWYVNEQVEEESSTNNVVQQLKMIGDNSGGGLFLLDKEMALRTFIYPPPALAPNP